MNSQGTKMNKYRNDENQCQSISTSTTSSTHNYPLQSSLFPNQVSRITNVLSSVDQYEDEPHIGHISNQHLAVNSSGRSGKAKSITRPTLISDFPVLNETSIHVNQIRRSGQSHPHEYKASAGRKQIPIATLYPTELTLNAFDEDAQETPIYVNHIHQQQSKGIRKAPKYISQLNTLTNYVDLDESPIQLDQLQRLSLAHPIKYKLLHDVQPSTGIIRKMPSVFIHEELSQEPSINIHRLRQANLRNIRPLNATKQQVISVVRPSISTNFDPIDETAFYLNQFHRPLAPQNIQYKAPVGLQPSAGSIIKTNSTLTDEDLFGEASLILNQMRQRHAQILNQQMTFV